MFITLYYYTNNRDAKLPYIRVKLFDNPTIEKWFDQYQEDQYRAWIDSYRETTQIDLAVAGVDYWWKMLHHTLNRLTEYGYTLPFTLESTFDYDQQTLNKLHRFFTYNQDWSNQDWLDKKCLVSNPFDSNFVLEKHDKKRWELLIRKINTAVHNLEKCTLPDYNRDFVDAHYPIECFTYTNTSSSHKDRWITFDQEDLKLNYNYLDLEHKHIVTLDKSILGKCLMQSFYENDDPTAQDCTGRLGSSGNFSIDLNDNRKKIYQSPEFSSWLSGYELNLKDMPLEFSIGFVVDSSSADLAEFKNFKFSYSEFSRSCRNQTLLRRLMG